MIKGCMHIELHCSVHYFRLLLGLCLVCLSLYRKDNECTIGFFFSLVSCFNCIHYLRGRLQIIVHQALRSILLKSLKHAFLSFLFFVPNCPFVQWLSFHL